jgi:hypothetical protein
MTVNILLTSCLCTEKRLRTPVFQNWSAAVGDIPGAMHRKAWEWSFICEALHERGFLEGGKNGLGFAVGEEPLVSLFAARGINVLATDLATEEARKIGWADTNQHASNFSLLNKRNLCDPELLNERVQFQFCDMTISQTNSMSVLISFGQLARWNTWARSGWDKNSFITRSIA